ncbi:Pentatricopeptide repeat-containing protein [Rhynchospora pubera]|uniref:Pentatricopeptide repeat-containing protein n=1 Tax=Rhynchospora pubera TaxID=906938 RepID=A0AAV8DN25_9POAL|nr:Pentatricopeptide repeat-containing protein [Rhynchospora pubera]
MEPALKLFDEISAQGIPCDTALYTSLIHGLFKSGDKKLAFELYNQMIKNGNLPDVITFTVLTHGLCRNEQRERESAKKVLGEMERFGVKPSAHIYNMLINSYFREGKFQAASFLHDDMLEKGIIPDEHTYDILL